MTYVKVMSSCLKWHTTKIKLHWLDITIKHIHWHKLPYHHFSKLRISPVKTKLSMWIFPQDCVGRCQNRTVWATHVCVMQIWVVHTVQFWQHHTGYIRICHTQSRGNIHTYKSVHTEKRWASGMRLPSFIKKIQEWIFRNSGLSILLYFTRND